MNCRCGPDTHAMSDMSCFVQATLSISQEWSTTSRKPLRLMIQASSSHTENHFSSAHQTNRINSMHVQECLPSQNTLIHRAAQVKVLGLCCCFCGIECRHQVYAPLPPCCNSPNKCDGHINDASLPKLDASCSSLNHMPATSDMFMVSH